MLSGRIYPGSLSDVNAQLAQMTYSSNLLNGVTWYPNEYVNVNTGATAAGAGMQRTDYIPVDPAKTYLKITGFLDVTTGCWYTSAKARISAITDNGLLTIPANAAYVMLNIVDNDGSINSCTVRHVNAGEIFTRNSFERTLFSTYYGKMAAFLGDSITQATGITYPYHAVVKDMLGLGFVLNRGYSGTSISASNGVDPTHAFTARYSLIRNNYDTVVVFGGTNDHSGNTPMGTIADVTDISFYGGMRVLCEGLINRFLGRKIVFITPLHKDNEGANSVGKTLTDYRNAMIEVCNLYGIPYIDGFTLGFNSLSNFKTKYMSDGLHPTQAGHVILGQAIANRLLSI